MPYEVGVREAKAKFSSLLARVREGGTITITDRGRPVAQLVAFPLRSASLEERLSEMEARGLLSASPTAAGPLPPLVSIPGDLAQKFLHEDRSVR